MGNQLRPSFRGLRPRDELVPRNVIRRFSETELRLIKATFKDLSLRSPGNTIDKRTFLHHFPLPGLHGEQLFDIFDRKQTGVVDFEEFISGIALCTKGDFEEKLELVFRICDITKDGKISADELTTMLHQVPKEALARWSDNMSGNEYEQSAPIVATKTLLVESETEAEGETTLSANSTKVGSVDTKDSTNASSNDNSRRSDKGGLRIDTRLIEYEVESKDNTSVPEETHAMNFTHIESIVSHAFASFALKRSEELTKEQFTQWVSSNVKVAYLFNSVFSSCKSPSTSPPPGPKSSNFSSSSSASIRSSIGGSRKAGARSLSQPGMASHHVNPDLFQSRKKAQSVGARALDLMSPKCASSPSHVCIKEGNLYKIGQRYKRLQRRYYRLCDDVLYYYTNAKSVLPCGVITLTGCFIEKAETSGLHHPGINIITSSGGRRDVRTLLCKSESELESWLVALKAASRVRVFKEEYEIKEKIGSGKFSDVYLGISKRSGKQHAVKIIDKAQLSEEEKEFLRTEVAILRLVHHPCIVELVDIVETQTRTYIVMELLEGGELFDYISGRSRFTELEAYYFMKQLVLGIKYLHSAGIAHRDLKPENVLLVKKQKKGDSIGADFQVKLTDFGLSKMVAPKQILSLPCGTISYVAPEILRECGYGIEADMWSLGVIMYLVIRGKLPFDHERKDSLIHAIVNEEICWDDDPFWAKTDPQLTTLLQGLLQKEHKLRLSAQQVLDHPWFKRMGDAGKSQLASDTCQPVET